MRSLTQRLAWLTVLGLSCFVFAQAQSEEAKEQSFVTIPASMMNRELRTIHNRSLKLSDYSRKIIILNSFADWCGPCVLNLKDLIRLKKTYKSHSIEVIGLVWDKNDPNIATVRQFARQLKIRFPVIWDRIGFQESLFKLVNGRRIIPQTFIIDMDGRIRKHFMGFDTLKTPRLLREALDQVGREKRTERARDVSLKAVEKKRILINDRP
jgi:peroxiredoxin